jgi:hypothetical protein
MENLSYNNLNYDKSRIGQILDNKAFSYFETVEGVTVEGAEVVFSFTARKC